MFAKSETQTLFPWAQSELDISQAVPSSGDNRELKPGCVYTAPSTGASGLDRQHNWPRVPRLD